MPNPAPAPADILAAVREETEQSWRVFSQVANLGETLTTWTTATAPDGRPIISAEVTGPEASHALKTFASTYHLALHHPGDLRPQVDVTVTDRAVLYWRRDGVWVELWHPNTVPEPPCPSRRLLHPWTTYPHPCTTPCRPPTRPAHSCPPSAAWATDSRTPDARRRRPAAHEPDPYPASPHQGVDRP